MFSLDVFDQVNSQYNIYNVTILFFFPDIICTMLLKRLLENWKKTWDVYMHDVRIIIYNIA